MASWQHWRGFLAAQGNGGWQMVLRRFTWELPQTLLGLGAGTWALLGMHVEAVGCRDGVLVIQCWRKERAWGGICFGSVILGDERICPALNNRLYMHEFGHALQSRVSGPIYLFKYGIPSVLSVYGKGVHSRHDVECDANHRACAYFSQQAGFTCWPQDYNPLPPSGRVLPIHWWEYVPPVFPLRQLWIAVRDRDGRAS